MSACIQTAKIKHSNSQKVDQRWDTTAASLSSQYMNENEQVHSSGNLLLMLELPVRYLCCPACLCFCCPENRLPQKQVEQEFVFGEFRLLGSKSRV